MIILWLLFSIIKITSLVTFIILLFCFDAPPLILLHTPSIPILPPNLIQIGRSDSLVVASWESRSSPFKPKSNLYTDVEFVTSRARVKHFWPWVKFSRINLKTNLSVYFAELMLYVGFQKITGDSLYLSTKTDNVFNRPIARPFLISSPKMSRFTYFSWVKDRKSCSFKTFDKFHAFCVSPRF